MCEPLLAHQVVGLKSSLQIIEMNANRAPHEHVLGPLGHLTVDFEQVGPLKRLKAEEVVLKISRIVNHFINALIVVLDDPVDLVGEKRCRPVALILKVVKLVGNLANATSRPIMKCLHCHSIGQFGVVRVHNGHVGARLRSQIRDLTRCHT